MSKVKEISELNHLKRTQESTQISNFLSKRLNPSETAKSILQSVE